MVYLQMVVGESLLDTSRWQHTAVPLAKESLRLLRSRGWASGTSLCISPMICTHIGRIQCHHNVVCSPCLPRVTLRQLPLNSWCIWVEVGFIS